MPRRTRSVLALAGLAVLSASSFNPAAAFGPDVIVGDLPDLRYFGTSGGIAAYSVATTSCNIGDAQLNWIENNSNHPVIAQNLYRIRDGQFVQIGQSWLKHGFCALQGTVCSSTPGYPACVPAGANCVSRLGIGCSDPYSSQLNGQQSNLGPRSQVNPWTGQFPYPFTAPGVTNTTTSRRLQVAVADLPPATPSADSIWLMEGHYVALDDSNFGNQHNNASYRRLNINSVSSFSNNGSTQRQKPAIIGWKDLDPTVTIGQASAAGDGRLYVGAKVVDNGNGTWTYNYAIYNMNSHRGAASFSVPLSCGTEASNLFFRAPTNHSGEPYSNAAWDAVVRTGDEAFWETQTESENPNANAIRWGTAYTFAVTANAAPAIGELSIGLFRGTPTTLAIGGMPVPGAGCRADWDTSGGVNSSDISAYLTSWLDSVQDGTLDADYDCDGAVNSNDISTFLTSWLAALTGGC